MRKLLSCALCLLILMPVYSISAQESGIDVHAPAAILMDYSSKQVLYEKNSVEQHYPASMTKMMSLLLVMEQLNAGFLRWDDVVVASEHASKLGGSQIYLEAGEQMTIEELVKSSALASANDAITALAEKVAGTESAFVSMMNKKAQELGCTNTNFVNPTGLHDVNHYSCAKDMALIAHALIKEGGDDILKYTSCYEDYIRKNSTQPFWLVNTNKMIRTYEGMDGLKTGYTSQSLYCISVTAKKEDMRLIAVVMNEPTKEQRTKDCVHLLDYGFANWQQVIDYKANTQLTTSPVEKGKPHEVDLLVNSPITHLEKKGESIVILDQLCTVEKIIAPKEAGDVVGTVTIQYSDGSTFVYPLSLEESIQELSFLEVFVNQWKKIIFS